MSPPSIMEASEASPSPPTSTQTQDSKVTKVETVRAREKRIRRLRTLIRKSCILTKVCCSVMTAYRKITGRSSSSTPKGRASTRRRLSIPKQRKRPLHTFSLFSLLPAEVRYDIWEYTLQPRVVKISPQLWDRRYRCRWLANGGQETGCTTNTCITHSNPPTVTPATFSATVESRGETKMYYRPIKLGQPIDTKNIWARLELDTILINDCLGPVGQGNALLSSTGFHPALIKSRDWNRIQHLAMHWSNFWSIDCSRRRRVLTKEIIKMRGIKTLTLVGNYVWNGAKGSMDQFIEMEEDCEESRTAALVRIEEDESPAEEYQKFKTKVRTNWEESVKRAMKSNAFEGIKGCNIPELKIRTLRMEDGYIQRYWGDEE